MTYNMEAYKARNYEIQLQPSIHAVYGISAGYVV